MFPYNHVEASVFAMLADLLDSPAFDAQFVAELQQRHDERVGGLADRRKALQARLVALNRQIEASLDAALKALFSGSRIAKRRDDWEAQATKLEQQIAAIDVDLRRDPPRILAEVATIKAALESISDHGLVNCATESGAKLAKVFRAIIRNITCTHADEALATRIRVEFDFDAGNPAGRFVMEKIAYQSKSTVVSRHVLHNAIAKLQSGAWRLSDSMYERIMDRVPEIRSLFADDSDHVRHAWVQAVVVKHAAGLRIADLVTLAPTVANSARRYTEFMAGSGLAKFEALAREIGEEMRVRRAPRLVLVDPQPAQPTAREAQISLH